MPHLLITNIGWLVTMNPSRDILRDAWLEMTDGFISALGTSTPPPASETLDARGGIVIPGMVNTHHHMFQNLARAYTPIANLPLLPWLKGHLPLWRTFTTAELGLATEMAMAELMLSGCTTTFFLMDSTKRCNLRPPGASVCALPDAAVVWIVRRTSSPPG
jgi:8-oxoguanine deaminase